jgi:hypothetical protein
MTEVVTNAELSARAAWIMRGIYIFACIFAFIADVHLIDETKKIRAWLRKLERWIKKLPIRAFMRWHIKWLSEHIEANIWKKHPDWICFIAGYLITAALSAVSILYLVPKVRVSLEQHKIPEYVLHALPSSVLLSPIPAAVFGGLVLVLTRHLLRWGKQAKLLFLYMAVIVWKAAIALAIFLVFFLSAVKAAVEFVLAHHPASDRALMAYYMQSEIVAGVLFWLISLDHVFMLMSGIIYCFEYCLLLWLFSHVAIWITKAIRLLLKKADGMYCIGAVGACSAFAESMIQAYAYMAAIPKNVWGLLQFFFGLGR